MSIRTPVVTIALALSLTLSAARSSAITIDFETLEDSEAITTQFAGVSFTNATVLTAGISLNEFENPPASGLNVAFAAVGPMIIVFDALQASVSGLVTYTGPVTLTALDALGGVLGSDVSDFSSNLALTGNPGSSPNELLQVAFAGIKSVVIDGNAVEGFTLDDLSSTPFTPLSVPEPGSLILVGTALVALAAKRSPANTSRR